MNKIHDAVKAVIDYDWEPEALSFFEAHVAQEEQAEMLQKPWLQWLKYAEDNEDEGATNHIFYHLMILRLNYETGKFAT